MKKMKMTAFLLSGAILLGSCGTMNNTTKGGIIGRCGRSHYRRTVRQG